MHVQFANIPHNSDCLERNLEKIGICSSCSCQSTSLATAKLILEDGKLQEYPYPVRVSCVLQKIYPASFICNSDEMGFDDVVSAVSDDDELQLGELYFVLPLCRLKRRLQAADMAALAVKASSALGRGSRGVVVFYGKNGLNPAGKVAENVGSRRRRGKFAARLSAIPE